jgi:hypothetical protein
MNRLSRNLPGGDINKKLWCVAAVVLAAAGTFAAQPHMTNAPAALQNARGELQAAERDKGGHRVNAIRLIDQAIGEIRAGIAAGS